MHCILDILQCYSVIYLTSDEDICRDHVHVKESFTVPALLELLHEGAQFDFAYIDASHTRSDTLLDAMLMWRLMATGAVVVFDDYQWPNHPR